LSSVRSGGRGLGLRAACEIVERVARECGSTAMVLTMHYCGTSAIEAHGTDAEREAIARGEHLATLAFSETGSRSHFWAPGGKAEPSGGAIALTAKKSWVTSAKHADVYVWSSRALGGGDGCTLWQVPAAAEGLRIHGGFDGLGLRGNDSFPVEANGALVDSESRMGKDGDGLGIMLGVVLPVFSLLSAAGSVGFMEAAVAATCRHATSTRHEHLGSSLADLPTIRAYVARMRIDTDKARALWLDAIAAVETGRDDATLRVLESKAAAGESATEVLDTAMRVCGGAAFRREVGVERRFRDARAATVMAPTTDQLYDFIGRVLCGMDLFG
jgi:alkylation response protein AidB-like acyl-CoA dehydrogenase